MISRTGFGDPSIILTRVDAGVADHGWLPKKEPHDVRLRRLIDASPQALATNKTPANTSGQWNFTFHIFTLQGTWFHVSP